MSRIEITCRAPLRRDRTHARRDRAHAPLLADGYNEPANAALMGHTADDHAARRRRAATADRSRTGMRAFLLFDGDAFVGDGDLRGIRGTAPPSSRS